MPVAVAARASPEGRRSGMVVVTMCDVGLRSTSFHTSSLLNAPTPHACSRSQDYAAPVIRSVVKSALVVPDVGRCGPASGSRPMLDGSQSATPHGTRSHTCRRLSLLCLLTSSLTCHRLSLALRGVGAVCHCILPTGCRPLAPLRHRLTLSGITRSSCALSPGHLVASTSVT